MLTQEKHSADELFIKVFQQEFAREFMYLSDVAAGRATKRADFTDKLLILLKEAVKAVPVPGASIVAELITSLPAAMQIVAGAALQTGMVVAEEKSSEIFSNQKSATTIGSLVDEVDPVVVEILAERVARIAAYRYEYALQHVLSDDLFEGVVPLAKIGVGRALEYVARELLPLTEFSLVHGLIGGKSGRYVDDYMNHRLKGKADHKEILTAEGIYRRSGWQDNITGDYYVLPKKESKTGVYTNLDDGQAKYGYARMPKELIVSYLFQPNSTPPKQALSQLSSYVILKKDITDYLAALKETPAISLLYHLQQHHPTRTQWQIAICSDDLSGLDFTGANMSGCDFSGSSFKNTQLKKANFSKTQLHGCDFSKAIFEETDFSHANLTYAILSKNDLSQVQMRHADCRFANLSESQLPKAIEGVLWHGTNLTGCASAYVKEIAILQKQQELQSQRIAQLQQDVEQQRAALLQLRDELNTIADKTTQAQAKELLEIELLRMTMKTLIEKNEVVVDHQADYIQQLSQSLKNEVQVLTQKWQELLRTTLPAAVKLHVEQQVQELTKEMQRLSRHVFKLDGRLSTLESRIDQFHAKHQSVNQKKQAFQYNPEDVRAHLAANYKRKAFFEINGVSQPVDEKTFTCLALVNERTQADKKEHALRRAQASDESEHKHEADASETPENRDDQSLNSFARDPLYWEINQLDEILKPKTEIDLTDIFNGELQSKFKDLASHSKTNQNVLLLGAPGCGKTMFTLRVIGAYARYLEQQEAVDPLGKLLHSRYDWVLYLSLPALTAEDLSSSYATIFCRHSLIPENITLTQEERLRAVNALLNLKPSVANPRVLLLLDSFDELSEALKTSVIQKFLINAPFQVIMTSRPWGFSENLKDQFVYHVETLGFSKEQVKTYIQQYPCSKENAVTFQEQLLHLFNKPLRMRALMYVPICLKLICQLAQSEEGLSAIDGIESATQLYQHLVYHLLKHNAQRYLDPSEKHPDLKVVHTFFTRLAFQTMVQDEKECFLEKPARLFAPNRAKFLLAKIFKDLPVNEDEKERSPIWRATMGANNPFLRVSRRNCYFMHLTMQEYMAACGMLVSLEDPSACEAAANFIVKQRTNPQYRRMFLYLAGLCKERPNILNHFFSLLLQPPHQAGSVYESCLIIDALEECGLSQNLHLKWALLSHIEKIFFYLFDNAVTKSKKEAFKNISTTLSETILVFDGTQILPKILKIAKGGILVDHERQISAIAWLTTVNPLSPSFTTILDFLLKLLEEEVDPNPYPHGSSHELDVLDAVKQTLIALATVRINDVLDFLLEKAEDTKRQVRRAALQALMALAPRVRESHTDDVLHLLLKETVDQDDNIREAALQALTALAPHIHETCINDVLNLLLEKAEDAKWRVKKASLQALTALAPRVHETRINDLLILLLKKAEDDEGWKSGRVQKAACVGLTTLAPRVHEARINDVLNLLLQKTDNAKWEIRDTALLALTALALFVQETRIPDLLIFLLKKAGDKDSSVRDAVLQALTALAPRVQEVRIDDELNLLLEKIGDFDKYIRHAALRTLATLTPRIPEARLNDIIGHLLQKTRDENEDVREATLQTFTTLIPRIPDARINDIITPLVQRTEDKDDHVRRAALKALTILAPRIPNARIDDVLNRHLLEKIVDEYCDYVRKAALQALSALAPRVQVLNNNVLNFLLDLINDDYSRKHYLALLALFVLAPRISETRIDDVLNPVLKQAENDNWQICELALGTLKALASSIPKIRIDDVLNLLLEKASDKNKNIRRSARSALEKFALRSSPQISNKQKQALPSSDFPQFPILQPRKQQRYVPGNSVSFFPHRSLLSSTREDVLAQKQASLILALNHYIQIKKTEEDAESNSSKDQIQAVKYIVRELKKDRSLQEISQDLDSKGKIDDSRLYQILKEYDPDVSFEAKKKCILM